MTWLSTSATAAPSASQSGTRASSARIWTTAATALTADIRPVLSAANSSVLCQKTRP